MDISFLSRNDSSGIHRDEYVSNLVERYKVKTNKFGAFQGDIVMHYIKKLPHSAKKTNNRVVAFGETTGHYHEVQGVNTAYEDDKGFYFQIAPAEKAEIVHVGGEHDPIEMAPGLIFIPRESQVEFDPVEDARNRNRELARLD
jgi:hypothetical protein